MRESVSRFRATYLPLSYSGGGGSLKAPRRAFPEARCRWAWRARRVRWPADIGTDRRTRRIWSSGRRRIRPPAVRLLGAAHRRVAALHWRAKRGQGKPRRGTGHARDSPCHPSALRRLSPLRAWRRWRGTAHRLCAAAIRGRRHGSHAGRTLAGRGALPLTALHHAHPLPYTLPDAFPLHLA